MRSVILFIAMSLDGCIADSSGGVDWLQGQEDSAAESNDAYDRFIKDVDTVVMGWNTYHQIVTELSPERWIYDDLTSYVVTHRREDSAGNIVFTQEDPCKLVRRLTREDGKNIWICGGASIVQPLLREDLIDRISVSVIPTILGGGIRLFENLEKETKLRFVKSEAGNGIVELTYERRS